MEEEVKNMIKLSYTKLNTKLKKRVAVIAAVMCAITVTSGCGSYNAELTWEIEESTVSEEADIESTKTPEEADMICVYDLCICRRSSQRQWRVSAAAGQQAL